MLSDLSLKKDIKYCPSIFMAYMNKTLISSYIEHSSCKMDKVVHKKKKIGKKLILCDVLKILCKKKKMKEKEKERK